MVPQHGAITEWVIHTRIYFSYVNCILCVYRSSCVLVADLGRLEIKSNLKSHVPDVRVCTSLAPRPLRKRKKVFWKESFPSRNSLGTRLGYVHTLLLGACTMYTVLFSQEATDEELDEAFYDHFTLTLSRLQVLLAGPKQDWTDAWSSSSSPLHLLEPATLDLELRKSLLPNDTRLPK